MRALQLLRSFWSGPEGRKGNAAILFGLALLPMVGAMGAAVDYSQANSNRTSMQKALDATALQLAKMMPLTQQDLDTKGWQIFSANIGNLNVAIASGDLVITTPATGQLQLSVTGQFQPQLAPVIGISQFPIGAHAQVTWGIKKLEIALALDNTGSMSSNNKLTELKAAANNLLTTLEQAAKTPGDVKVSIIPFHVNVNVGGFADKNTAWLKWDRWTETEGTCSKKPSQYLTKTQCENNSGTWTVASHDLFDGCVEDRDKDPSVNHDALDTTPTNTATRFPARRCDWSLAQALPLTYDWTALHNRVNAMTAAGNTNVTIGLVWGWHSLTNTTPLDQAAAPATDLSKYIILLTDGDNTQNRWSTSESSINARTTAACTNIKAAGIRIYTIRVINGNADLLRNCATDPSMYFDVQNASQLESVFNAIGGQLASLHLSQ